MWRFYVQWLLSVGQLCGPSEELFLSAVSITYFLSSFDVLSLRKKYSVSSLGIVMEEHLMWRKEKDEASFFQVKMNIPVVRVQGALNAFPCYCHSLTLLSLMQYI